MGVLNAKGRAFSWSPSSLMDFEGCPRRYAERRFYCTVVEPPTEQTIWGERVHKAFEERVRDGRPFEPDFRSYEPWARVLSDIPGEKFCEKELAVAKDFSPCSWFDKNAWGRSKIDLFIVRDHVGRIYDYKTGKVRYDDTQMKIYCWLAANAFPDLHEFKYNYIWLKDGTATGGRVNRLGVEEDIAPVMLERVGKMEQAWETDNFPMSPSGLCSWCPVATCIHWRERG